MHGAGAAIPGLTCHPIFYTIAGADPERKIIIIIPDVACMASLQMWAFLLEHCLFSALADHSDAPH